jgi:hypothetical protein
VGSPRRRRLEAQGDAGFITNREEWLWSTIGCQEKKNRRKRKEINNKETNRKRKNYKKDRLQICLPLTGSLCHLGQTTGPI